MINNKANDIANKQIEEELKYPDSRCVKYDSNAIYIYRDIEVNVTNNVTFLHFISKENYTRDVRSSYSLCIKDNTLTHEQLVTIFTNIEYAIEVIKKRILNVFTNSISFYDNIEEGFEVIYNKSSKEFTIKLEYQVQDRYAPDCKNGVIVEIIIGTLLAIAEELKDSSDNVSNLTITDGNILVNNSVKL